MQSWVDHNDMIVTGQRFMQRACPITRVHASKLSAREFASYANANEPLLIEGAASSWPALQRWVEPDYLPKIVGDQEINYYPHINYQTVERHHDRRERVKFGVAFARLRDAATKVGAAAWPINSIPGFTAPDHLYETLKADIPGFAFLPLSSRPITYPRWRGLLSRNAGTGWHFHPVDCTLMVQIAGVKTVGLLPPDRETFETVHETFLSDGYFDDGDALGDAGASLAPRIAVIGVGDALFIPPYWWHGVQANPGFGITVPYCWRSPLHVIGALGQPANRYLRKTIAANWRKREHLRATTLFAVGVAAAFPRLFR